MALDKFELSMQLLFLDRGSTRYMYPDTWLVLESSLLLHLLADYLVQAPNARLWNQVQYLLPATFLVQLLPRSLVPGNYNSTVSSPRTMLCCTYQQSLSFMLTMRLMLSDFFRHKRQLGKK